MAMSAPAPDFGIVGGLALDNVIVAGGDYHVAKPGGNTLWASLGGAMFDASVGIVARAGIDYPDAILATLASCGVNTDGVLRTGRPHALRIAYKHLPDGRRLQPVPDDELVNLPDEVRKAFVDTTVAAHSRQDADPTLADIPSSWRSSVRAWHIPLVPLAVHRSLVAGLASPARVRLIADCPNRHEIGDMVADMLPSLGSLDVFLPSSSDIEIIDPDADPVAVARELAKIGQRVVVLKQGAAGVTIFEPGAKEYTIPSVPVRAVDPTGAGDAFCGGFLVGLDASDDPVVAAIYGSIAASFAVETADPLVLAEVSPAERDERMQYLRQRLNSN
jgi:ribokinase